MAQPFTKDHQLGIALLNEDMLKADQPLQKRFSHVLQEID